MFEKLLEHRESIHSHVTVAVNGSSDEDSVSNSSDDSDILSGTDNGKQSPSGLFLDVGGKGGGLRAPAQDRGVRDLLALASDEHKPKTGREHDQLGLCELSNLVAKMSDDEARSKLSLRTATSWDVSSPSADRVQPEARRCHSSASSMLARRTAAAPACSAPHSSPKSLMPPELTVTYHEQQTACRRKLESEDSSYDSDHDNHLTLQLPPGVGSRWPEGTISVAGELHEDISRKPSETLAAEFNEYVSIKHHESPRAGYDTPPLDDALLKLSQDEDYKSKVLFAVRLGYSEALLQKALLKLGTNAGQNQLLEELIRLQKSKPMDRLSVKKHPGTRSDGSMNVSYRNDEFSSQGNELLPIVIDGSNVAMSHGNKDKFSCKGIKICVDWFKARGHREITVFVPKWRKESSKPETPITDQHTLIDLEREGLLTFTPSRQVRGKRFVCHDDRYILNLAADTGAVVVSNDNFRELIMEKPEFKKVIEERILMYSFVKERFMPPDDPLGKNGPSLNEFLRKKPSRLALQQPCPYGKKCTYGNKCKFFHADRGSHPQKSITEKLKESSSLKMNEIYARSPSRDPSPGDHLTRTRSMQLMHSMVEPGKQDLCRAKSSFPRLVDDSQPPSFMTHNVWADGSPPWSQHELPPAPPRTPWTGKSRDPQSANMGEHKKLARQLTLNPEYDPRIHRSPPYQLYSNDQLPVQQRFDYPPPSPASSTMGIEAQDGMVGLGRRHLLTRKSSAPSHSGASFSSYGEGQFVVPCLLQPPTGFRQHQQQMTSSHYDPMTLHKTLSDSPMWGSKSGGGTAVLGLPTAVNSSSFEYLNDEVTSQTGRKLGPIGSRRSSHPQRWDGVTRDNLYFHLSALFPREQVLEAMKAMPDITDPQIICKHILSTSGK